MCLSGKKAERRLVIRIVPRASLSPLSHRSPPLPHDRVGGTGTPTE